MPPKSTTDDEIPLEDEIKKLRDAGSLSINLAADAHYPTHLVIAARDQHASELPDRALGDAFDIPQLPDPDDEEDTSDTGGEGNEEEELESNSNTDDEEDTSDIEEEENDGQKLEGDPADETVLRPSDENDKLAPGVALNDIGGTICQVVSRKTRQDNSVLGRVGALDILCDQLTTCLRQRGIWAKATLAMAARLAYGDTNEFDADVKRLERLNHGHFISEKNLGRFAQFFGLRVEDLVFTHPAIYESAAWKRRRKRKRNARRN